MRPIKELLIIVRDNADVYLTEERVSGLCGLIYELCNTNDITHTEYSRLQNYLSANIPTNAKKRRRINFSNHPLNKDFDLNAFWWAPYSVAPRLKWLNKQIEKLN